MSQGRRALTQDFYEKALALYRETPGACAEVARRLPCSRQLAKRLWAGPPYPVYPWARPISLVIEDERRAARARQLDLARQAQEADAAEREKARMSHIDSLAQEAQMMKVARGDTLAALALAAELTPAMRQLARVIVEAAKPKPDGAPPDISAVQAMALLSRHTQLIQRAVGAAETLVQLGRLERGQSTANVGVGGFSSELSFEEALEELTAVEATIQAMKGKGGRPAALLAEGEDA